MNIGVLQERNPGDRRVALTPAVVRQLAARGHKIWFERGAGNGAMFTDEEFTRAGASLAYSAPEVIHRSDLVVKISTPRLEEVEEAHPGCAIMAFYHMAVAGAQLFQRLVERRITAIGCEIIETDDGRLPVLAAPSEIAGQMAIPLATHLLRSSSGGRGILLGGSPGVPPAHVVILGAGTVGTWAARAAVAAGARVTVLDIDPEKLRRLVEHVPHVATALADPDSVAAAVEGADVLIGAVLVAGARTPHVVTRQMVERMRPGSVVIDVAIDQGGCVETSRPTTIAEPTFVYRGVVHYCVPNMTADMGRSASIAIAQALMPYVLTLADRGIEGALRSSSALARGVYLYRGDCVQPRLAAAWNVPCHELQQLLDAGGGHESGLRS
ncbi:MAG: alanine dehydrogenase [Bryobacterales bacterium]|nr:alanine dehydrogenase [Bryobacteraceae bacterium]MDW8129135.1 alanine dehydrogenase [Bryobacterales bacterium]